MWTELLSNPPILFLSLPTILSARLKLVSVPFSSLLLDISEFTQRDSRKKRTANRLCVTNVTRL